MRSQTAELAGTDWVRLEHGNLVAPCDVEDLEYFPPRCSVSDEQPPSPPPASRPGCNDTTVSLPSPPPPPPPPRDPPPLPPGPPLPPAAAATPYLPTSNWTYYLEAAHAQPWPSCAYRFLSYTSDCGHDDLYNSVGANQEFWLSPAPEGNQTFYLRLSCGKYLSVAGACSNTVVETWPQAGINQAFRFVSGSDADLPFKWAIEAVGRASCTKRYLSFASSCSDHAVVMGGTQQPFRLHAVHGPAPTVTAASAKPCADPFSWYSRGAQRYYVACTDGALGLEHVATVSASMTFVADGTALDVGSVPAWASSGNRWAPENLELQSGGGNALFFSDSQSSDGRHRVGWAMSGRDGRSLAGSFNTYAAAPLALGDSAGGEIDQHVFRDDANGGATYLLWKTDDNSVGAKTTRLWAQRVAVAPGNVTLLGAKQELLDSSGLWWAPSFVSGGSLVEAPEMLYRDGWYYLFFAAGLFCTTSYAEGVARSKSVFGPFEKLPVPLLSSGLSGGQLTGPGHASFVADAQGRHFAVYHASTGSGSCQRYAFVSRMRFTSDGWPYVTFETSGEAARPPLVEEKVHGEEDQSGTHQPTTRPCRIVVPCDAIVDDPSLRVGAPMVCAGQPCRRLGGDGGVGGNGPGGDVVLACSM